MLYGLKSSIALPIKFQQRKFDCFALFFLALLVIVIHRSALSGSWRWDDGMHLLHTTQYDWTSIFLDPDVLRSVSGNQFAPWNLFLYYINKYLFGTNVKLYYLHHLLSIWAAATGLYVLMRQWLPVQRSLVAPALLLIGAPAVQMAQQLMVGHYIDGFVFATFGLVFHIQAVKIRENAGIQSLALSLTGALLYGLACICKEIYVPWVLMWIVVPWLIIKSVHTVATCAAPALVVALAYTLARFYVFEGAAGYYGGGAGNWNVANVARSLCMIPSVFFGNGLRGGVSLTLICISLVAGIRYSLAWGAVCISAIVVTLVPLVVLAGGDPPWALHSRYLWAPWILLAMVWALPWRGLFSRWQFIACLIFAVLVMWQVSSVLRPGDQQHEALFDAHSKLILQSTREVTHWVPAEFNGASYVTFVTYAAHEALRRMGQKVVEPPKILRTIPNSALEQAATHVWDSSCVCFRQFSAIAASEREGVVIRARSERGLLLPGLHPLADAYMGPTPQMRRDGNRLHVTGRVNSEGAGHVLILAGWEPSRLVSSAVAVEQHLENTAVQNMRFEIVLEAEDAAAMDQTRVRLCVLMQSQAHPYTVVALDATAPSTACRALLTPWGLRMPAELPP